MRPCATSKQFSELRDNQQIHSTTECGNQLAIAEANKMWETVKKNPEESEKNLQEKQHLRNILEKEINELKTKNTELESKLLKSKNVFLIAKGKKKNFSKGIIGQVDKRNNRTEEIA